MKSKMIQMTSFWSLCMLVKFRMRFLSVFLILMGLFWMPSAVVWADLSTGLVAHYKFEGNAKDSSGNNNHGTEHGGVSYADGVIGKTSSFDGVNDYIKIPQSNTLNNLKEEMTISFWTKYYKLASTAGVSVHITNGNDVAINKEYGYFNYSLPGGIGFYLGYWGNAQSINIPIDATQSLNKQDFVFVSFVVDKKSLKAYKNSIKINDEIRKYHTISRPSSDWTIGNMGHHYYLNGQIDDLRIYNRALSELEIKALYNLGAKNNNLILKASNATINAGSKVNINAEIKDAVDTYGIQSTFIVDQPEKLTLTGIKYGEFLDKNNRLEIPNEFNALSSAQLQSDRFTTAISLRNPAKPVTGSGTFSSMTYKTAANAYGTVKISTNDVVFTDKDGQELSSASQGTTITINHPILEEGGETVIGTITFPPNVPSTGATIILENENGDRFTIIVDENGNFSFKDLKDGTYKLWVDKAPYFGQCVTVEVKNAEIKLEPIKMLNGNVNRDGKIDIGDVTLVASYFGKKTNTIPKDSQGVDLNSDGKVNIQDLAIVGANFGMERCPKKPKVNHVMNFDGNNDYVVANSSVISSNSSPYTVSVTVTPNGGASAYIISNGGQNSSASGFFITNSVLSNPPNRNVFKFGFSDNNQTIFMQAGKVSNNQKTTLTAVYNGKSMTIYQDGMNVKTKIIYQGKSLNRKMHNVTLGASSNIFNKYRYKGTIDNVQIYNKALNANEVKFIQNGDILNNSNLALHYDFEGSNPLEDKSGNNYDAIIHGDAKIIIQ